MPQSTGNHIPGSGVAAAGISTLSQSARGDGLKEFGSIKFGSPLVGGATQKVVRGQLSTSPPYAALIRELGPT